MTKVLRCEELGTAVFSPGSQSPVELDSHWWVLLENGFALVCTCCLSVETKRPVEHHGVVFCCGERWGCALGAEKCFLVLSVH